MIYQNHNTRQINKDEAGIFVLRELEQMMAKEFDTLYIPPSLARLVPVDAVTPIGAKAHTYKVYDRQHRAKIISNFADDLPLVNVLVDEISYKVQHYGSAYTLNTEEVSNALFTGLPLEQRLLNTVAESLLVEMSTDGWFGNTKHDIPGWLNNPYVNSATVAGANAGARIWCDANGNAATKTPDQILADINAVIDFIMSNSKGMETPDTLVLPLLQYRYIEKTPRGANNDTTILEFILEKTKSLNLTITWAEELKGAFAGGTNGMILYKRSREKLYQDMPQLFKQEPEQKRNLAFIVNCTAIYGGVHVLYPASMAFRYGI